VNDPPPARPEQQSNQGSNELLSNLLQQSAVRHSELLAEYTSLRSEMIQNSHFTTQLISGFLALSGALMVFSFGKEVKYPQRMLIYFIVAFIGIVGLWINMSRYQGTMVAASYLREFTEPNMTGVKWETRLVLFRDKYRGLNLMYEYGFTYTAIIFINLVLIVYTAITVNSAAYVWAVIITVLLVNLFFLVGIGKSYESMPKEIKIINKTWRKVHQEEDEH
jgi:hypothetical protein